MAVLNGSTSGAGGASAAIDFDPPLTVSKGLRVYSIQPSSIRPIIKVTALTMTTLLLDGMILIIQVISA